MTLMPPNHVVANSYQDNTLSNNNYINIVVVILAAIDTTFYVWIIQSINALLATLAARQQGMKYILYRNFRGVLFLSLFCALVWGLYSGLVIFNDTNSSGSGVGSDQAWQSRWTVEALWEFIYFILLAAIAQMWAPNSNSQRYAYSVELTQLDDDDEYLEAGSKSKTLRGNLGRSSDGDDIDNEYGGKLDDTEDPFALELSGALDTASAVRKSD